MNKKTIQSNLLLLLTALIWGFAFVAQRASTDYLGAFTFNGIRFALGAISLLPIILFRNKKSETIQDLKDNFWIAMSKEKGK